MSEPHYEALEPISKEDALNAIRGESDLNFGRSIASAALHSTEDDLDELFAVGARHLDGPERARMLCGAISTAAQARGVVPPAAPRVLSDLQWRDDAGVASARDEALELVARAERSRE